MPPEKCCICQYDFLHDDDNIVLLGLCEGHFYHSSCTEDLRQNKDFVICPICKAQYGEEVGEMPSGVMQVTFDEHAYLPGFSKRGCICIDYTFPSQNFNGSDIHGTNRTAFLPNTREGVEVLSMLVKAFENKLTFKVGISVTTGAENSIVWNGIHHKTSMTEGPYGYPDETYLTRVKQELNAKGIF